MLKEFKEFALKGNVLDMAIGIVIGAAFSDIVNALVEYIIMPIVGALTAGIDLSGLSLSIGDVDIVYGQFLNALISFIIIAFALFLFVKVVNNLRSDEASEEEEKDRICPYCKMEVPEDAIKCGHCGSYLKSEGESAQSPKEGL